MKIKLNLGKNTKMLREIYKYLSILKRVLLESGWKRPVSLFANRRFALFQVVERKFDLEDKEFHQVTAGFNNWYHRKSNEFADEEIPIPREFLMEYAKEVPTITTAIVLFT